MTGPNGEFREILFCSDDVPERDRLAYVREAYGRAIVCRTIP